MPKKMGIKGQETRARLLAYAAAEFANLGFHQTKISSIVAKAGLSQPSFYLYFPSKEAVFEELVSKFRADLRSIIQGSILDEGIEIRHVRQRIIRSLGSMFYFLGKDPHLTQIGFILSPEVSEIKQEMCSQLEHNLCMEQTRGYFRDNLNMKTVAESLMGIIERLTVTQLLPGLQHSAYLAEQVVDILLYGLIAPEHES